MDLLTLAVVTLALSAAMPGRLHRTDPGRPDLAGGRDLRPPARPAPAVVVHAAMLAPSMVLAWRDRRLPRGGMVGRPGGAAMALEAR